MLRIVLTILGLTNLALAQSWGDCDAARELTLSLDQRLYSIDTPAIGSGALNEIEAPRGDRFFFREEHNTHWYHFRLPFTGMLGLEIRPKIISDDYDFLLFPDSTGQTCDQIRLKELLPVRSVISRNDTSLQSRTGLSAFARATHQQEGPGTSFTRAVEVERGQQYYLVIDNVYGGGEGYELEFYYYYEPRLFGQVIDAQTHEGLPAKIYLEETESGLRVDSMQVDSSGRYAGLQPLEFQKTYKLSFVAEGHFIQFREVNFPYLKQHRGEAINVALTPMEVGVSITLDNIHFKGGLAEFVPATYPALREVLSLMRQYPSLVVELEGHVNGVGTPNCETLPHLMQLSIDRAKAVQLFLVENGIEPARMSIQGYGCHRMLFPEARSEAEMAKNRRVELKVVAF